MNGISPFEPSKFYHVVNHAVGNENIFRNEENYQYFLKKYAQYIPTVCDTYAYCLMPNHIHFLIKTYDEDVLSKHPKFKGDYHRLVMQPLSNLLNAYTKAYNKVYNRKGALWLDFTKRYRVDTDNYLTTVIAYIHLNPVKHGFCTDATAWKYSSYGSMLSNKTTALKREAVLDWFGGDTLFQTHHHDKANFLSLEWE